MSDKNNDLKVGVLERQNWDGDGKEPLGNIFEYVTAQAEDAIEWYLKKKSSKKFWARSLRLAAIISTSVAGLIPLISEINTTAGVPDVPPALASVALLLAVTFVGLDRFFGFSTAWMRFLSTELKIRNALQLFRVEWEIKSSSLKGTPPNEDQLQERLVACRDFLVTINSAVESEMLAWKNEFQTALKQIDDAAQAKQEIEKLGGVNIRIKNPNLCIDGWSVSIDDGLKKKCEGKTAAFNNLQPGMHKIKLTSSVGEDTYTAEKAVTIPAGSSLDVLMELS